MEVKLWEIVQAAGGRLLQGDGGACISSFITDSREAGPGAMFVPIRGERTDGHAYVGAALRQGAAASFTDHPLPGLAGEPIALVLVPDCRRAMQQAAAWYRGRFSLPIVGITGSVGKTTAKEMAAQALSARFSVHKTPGNQNSQVGVPATICGLGPCHTAAVVEMGISMPGEMARIAEVVKPTCGAITNIGVSHIEFLKTRENILKEKTQIAGYLPPEGVLFVNGDDELLPGLKETALYPVRTFGLGSGCDWQAAAIQEAGGSTMFACLGPDGRETPVAVPVVGTHNVRNALMAVALADHLGIPREDAAQALAGYQPPTGRQQILQAGGVTLIDDSYNASPDSMRSALDVLASRPCGGKRVALLADMLELGDLSQEGHAQVGAYAREKGIDQLVALGPLAKYTAESFGPGAKWFADKEEATAFLCGALSQGDVVLVKGSRGMGTETVVKALRSRAR